MENNKLAWIDTPLKDTEIEELTSIVKKELSLLPKSEFVAMYEKAVILATIQALFQDFRKKYLEAINTPIELRKVIFEMCDFLDEYTEEKLREAGISTKMVDFVNTWKQILKPIKR